MPSHDCPTCKKKLEYAGIEDLPHFPFCGERCRLVDLGRWFDEGYVISQPLRPEDELELENRAEGEPDSPAPAPPRNDAGEDD